MVQKVLRFGAYGSKSVTACPFRCISRGCLDLIFVPERQIVCCPRRCLRDLHQKTGPLLSDATGLGEKKIRFREHLAVKSI